MILTIHLLLRANRIYNRVEISKDMKKNNKKKFVPLIIVSSLGLLFGGLIFLGVSAFPELMEEEKEAEKEHAHVTKTDTLVGDDGSISEAGSVGGGATETAPYSGNDIEFITIGGSGSVKMSNESGSKSYSHKDFFIIESYQLTEDIIITSPSNSGTNIDANVISDNASNDPSKADEEAHQVETVKTISANKFIRSKQAVVETSLIVIGVVDVIAMIIIQRKKRLLL